MSIRFGIEGANGAPISCVRQTDFLNPPSLSIPIQLFHIVSLRMSIANEVQPPPLLPQRLEAARAWMAAEH